MLIQIVITVMYNIDNWSCHFNYKTSGIYVLIDVKKIKIIEFFPGATYRCTKGIARIIIKYLIQISRTEKQV